MQAEWVKIRVWLAKDPQVIAMADWLAGHRPFMSWLTNPVNQSCKKSAYEHVTRDVMRAVTVASLITVWGMANQHGVTVGSNALLRHATVTTIDDICGIPGFGAAMIAVGWLTENRKEGTVTFPGFMSYNVPADERERNQNAERQRRYRARHKSNTTVTPPLHKRHESDGEITPRSDREQKQNRILSDLIKNKKTVAPRLPKAQRKKTEKILSDSADSDLTDPIAMLLAAGVSPNDAKEMAAAVLYDPAKVGAAIEAALKLKAAGKLRKPPARYIGKILLGAKS